MEKQIFFIQNQLNILRDSLAEEQEYFKVMVDREIHTSNFEKNAISVLNNMLEVRAKIHELEFVLNVLKIKE